MKTQEDKKFTKHDMLFFAETCILELVTNDNNEITMLDVIKIKKILKNVVKPSNNE